MSDPLTPAGVLAAVTELLPVLRDRAQEAEDARRIPDETIKSLQATGFFKLLQPTRYGGLEASPVEFYRAVRLIASACNPNPTRKRSTGRRRASCVPAVPQPVPVIGGTPSATWGRRRCSPLTAGSSIHVMRRPASDSMSSRIRSACTAATPS